MIRQILRLVTILTFFLLAFHSCFEGQYGRNDATDDKFTKCCEDKNVTCPQGCKYPPNFNQSCIFKWSPEFIKCFTGGHNNTKCCAEHGVVGIYGICQDFCDGTVDHGWDPRYILCYPVIEIISNCNYQSQKPNCNYQSQKPTLL